MPTPEGFAAISMQITQTSLIRPAYITFGVANPTDLSPDDVADGVMAAANAAGSWTQQLDSSAHLTNVTARVGQAVGDDLVGFSAGSFTGPLARESLPPNCAVLVHKRTARGGRKGRGRMFMPWWGTSESNVDEAGLIATGTLSGINVTLNDWLAALSAEEVPMFLLHGEFTPPVLPDLVTDLQAEALISTQRRRLGR